MKRILWAVLYSVAIVIAEFVAFGAGLKQGRTEKGARR